MVSLAPAATVTWTLSFWQLDSGEDIDQLLIDFLSFFHYFLSFFAIKGQED